MPRGTSTIVRVDPVPYPASKKIYVGIDNGVSGSVAVLKPGEQAVLFPTPTFSDLNYTKEKKNINRIDRRRLTDLLVEHVPDFAFVVIERPMVNPKRFQASISACRALEATLGVVEDLGFSYQYLDSREWQKALLPSGCNGAELKSAAVAVARRLFPYIKTKDADALIMAEYARRRGL